LKNNNNINYDILNGGNEKLFTEEKAKGFGYRREQHGRCHFTDNSANMLFVRLVGATGFTLVRLNQDENIVNTHGQHQEGDDFDNNQSGGHTDVTVKSDRGDDRQKHNNDTSDTQRNLAVNL
jgi:hypothetical protein